MSLEMRALRWAVLVPVLALSIIWLLAASIKKTNGSATISRFQKPEIAISPALVEQGREFYGMSCSHCHADDATGDEGPNLHNLSISNARIAATIQKGIKGEMPSFSKKYDDNQISALVAYLRTLR